MLWFKLGAGLVVLLALAGAARWLSNTIERANERDAAVARVAAVEKEKADLAATFASAQRADVDIAADLAQFRAGLADELTDFSQRIKAKPLTREVVPRDTSNGIPEPCRERDPVRYRGLFNAAVAGTAAP